MAGRQGGVPVKLTDRVLGYLGLQRRAKRNAFAGAATGRLTLDWIKAPLASADKELEGDLLELRKRSRDLVRNNGYARRFVKLAQNNIVGPRGMQLRPVNTYQDGRPADPINDSVRAAWLRWGRPEYASLSGRLSWVRLQRLAVAEWITAGEALFQIVRDATHPFGLTLQPIDADRLDQSLMVAPGPDRNEIRYGVEVDAYGRPLFYHILRHHPNDLTRVYPSGVYRDRIPASEIIHLALLDERVDMTRGRPQLASGLRDLRHLDGAQEASVVALRKNAAESGFIVTKSPDGEVEAPTEDVFVDGEPGTYRSLGLGQEIQVPEWNQPADNYTDFTRTVLRQIGSGWGTSYAFLSGDWSDANFGSMRIGRADEQDGWEALQEWFVEAFCRRVFEAWLPSAVMAGGLRIPNYDLTRAERVEWQGRRWTSPKPLEDVEVYERRIALGLDSRSEIKGREGGDLWQTWEFLAEENDYAGELGLTVEPPRTGVTEDEPSDDAATGDAAAPGDGRDGGAGDGSGDGRTGRDARAGSAGVPHRDVLGTSRRALRLAHG